MRAAVEVDGMGTGEPTYIPRGSFEPLILRGGETLGMYVAADDGPYILAVRRRDPERRD